MFPVYCKPRFSAPVVFAVFVKDDFASLYCVQLPHQHWTGPHSSAAIVQVAYLQRFYEVPLVLRSWSFFYRLRLRLLAQHFRVSNLKNLLRALKSKKLGKPGFSPKKNTTARDQESGQLRLGLSNSDSVIVLIKKVDGMRFARFAQRFARRAPRGT